MAGVLWSWIALGAVRSRDLVQEVLVGLGELTFGPEVGGGAAPVQGVGDEEGTVAVLGGLLGA